MIKVHSFRDNTIGRMDHVHVLSARVRRQAENGLHPTSKKCMLIKVWLEKFQSNVFLENANLLHHSIFVALSVKSQTSVHRVYANRSQRLTNLSICNWTTSINILNQPMWLGDPAQHFFVKSKELGFSRSRNSTKTVEVILTSKSRVPCDTGRDSLSPNINLRTLIDISKRWFSEGNAGKLKSVKIRHAFVYSGLSVRHCKKTVLG